MRLHRSRFCWNRMWWISNSDLLTAVYAILDLYGNIVFSPPAIPTGEDLAAIIVAGFFGQLKKLACRARAVGEKQLAVLVICLKEVFILFHFVLLLHSFLISESRLVLSYGYIIYCNTVYVKRFLKYFFGAPLLAEKERKNRVINRAIMVAAKETIQIPPFLHTGRTVKDPRALSLSGGVDRHEDTLP